MEINGGSAFKIEWMTICATVVWCISLYSMKFSYSSEYHSFPWFTEPVAFFVIGYIPFEWYSLSQTIDSDFFFKLPLFSIKNHGTEATFESTHHWRIKLWNKLTLSATLFFFFHSFNSLNESDCSGCHLLKIKMMRLKQFNKNIFTF